MFEKTFKKSEKFLPDWSHKFKHHHQMDTATFFLAEFFWQIKKKLPELPEAIVLESPQSSYFSDLEYCTDSKAKNPAKFIYTLPSVKNTVICGILDWEGPIYCSLFQDSIPSSIASWRLVFHESKDYVNIKLQTTKSRGNNDVPLL